MFQSSICLRLRRGAEYGASKGRESTCVVYRDLESLHHNTELPKEKLVVANSTQDLSVLLVSGALVLL